MADPIRSGAIFRVRNSECFRSPMPKFHNIRATKDDILEPQRDEDEEEDGEEGCQEDSEFVEDVDSFGSSFDKMVQRYKKSETAAEEQEEEASEDGDDAIGDGEEALELEAEALDGDFVLRGSTSKNVANGEYDDGGNLGIGLDSEDDRIHNEIEKEKDVGGSRKSNAKPLKEADTNSGRRNNGRERRPPDRFVDYTPPSAGGRGRSRKEKRDKDKVVIETKKKKAAEIETRPKNIDGGQSETIQALSSDEVSGKLCERCGISHDGSYGSGRFCSSKCCYSRRTKRGRPKGKSAKTKRSPKKLRIRIRKSPKMAVHLNDKVGETAPQAQIPTPKSASRRKRQSFISPEPKIKAEQIAVGRSRRGRLVMKPLNWWDLERARNGVVFCDPLTTPEDNAAETIREKHGIGIDEKQSPYIKKTKPRSKKTSKRSPTARQSEGGDEKIPSTPNDGSSNSGVRRVASKRKAASMANAEQQGETDAVPSSSSRGRSKDRSSESEDGIEETDQEELVPVSEDGWSKKQTMQLLIAHGKIRPSAQFWNIVAKKVRGKSARECAEKYNCMFPTPAKKGKEKKSKTSNKTKDKVEKEKTRLFKTLALPKGRAPVKRIKAYRSVLKMADNAHGADDYFESTPNRKRMQEIKSKDISLDVLSPPDPRGSPGDRSESSSEESGEMKQPLEPGAYDDADHDRADSHIQKLRKTIRSQNYSKRRVAAKFKRREKRAKRNGTTPPTRKDDQKKLPVRMIKKQLGTNIIENEHQPLRNLEDENLAATIDLGEESERSEEESDEDSENDDNST